MPFPCTDGVRVLCEALQFKGGKITHNLSCFTAFLAPLHLLVTEGTQKGEDGDRK